MNTAFINQIIELVTAAVEAGDIEVSDAWEVIIRNQLTHEERKAVEDATS